MGGTDKAGFIIRAAAFILDSLIVGVLAAVFLGIFKLSGDSKENLVSVVFVVYLIISTFKYNQTLGKRFFGLKVISSKGNLSIWRVILREFIGRIVSTIFLSLGYFWIIWDKQKQGWHDKIAKTYVVQISPIGKSKKILADIIVFSLPFLVILAIAAAAIPVAINPVKQLEKVRELQNQKQEIEEKQESITKQLYINVSQG